MKSIAVVGASLAGLRSVEALRKEGFDGTIHLVGDEPRAPYDRPPLSKQVLAGEWDLDRIELSTQDKLAELDIEAHFGTAATALNVGSLQLSLDSGHELGVDGVIIATGARCRTIGPPRAGVHTLRTADDAVALRAALTSGISQLVVVGAGFIGAEVAATAREMGLEVTIVEMASVPFERSLGARVGSVLAEVHRGRGTNLRLGVGVSGFVGSDTVQAVQLTDGTAIDADLVVVGVGVTPNTEWLASSGLDVSDGVLCDETTLAAPGVVAAGDVARWPNNRFGETMRVEHWDNAITQGIHAAKRLLHGDSVGAYAPTPWFWTDQFDRKVQLAGRTTGHDRFEVVAGDIESHTFAGIYGRQGTIIGVVGFNRPRHVMRYRALIDAAASFDEAVAADI